MALFVTVGFVTPLVTNNNRLCFLQVTAYVMVSHAVAVCCDNAVILLNSSRIIQKSDFVSGSK